MLRIVEKMFPPINAHKNPTIALTITEEIKAFTDWRM